MSAKISRWGNSAAVRLPKEVLEQAGFREGESIDFKTGDGVVELRKRRPTIEELSTRHESEVPSSQANLSIGALMLAPKSSTMHIPAA